MSLRLPLLLALCGTLTSCGTASHFLGMASGLVNSVTSPVLGAVRLSDSPDQPAPHPKAYSASTTLHDPRPTPAKRRR